MKKAKLLVLLTALMALTASCSRSHRAEHVVIIGIDGWASSEFDPAEMPFCASLMEQGSWTLEKRCVAPPASAINWMTIFSGVPPEFHGYTKWNSTQPEVKPVWTDERGEVPTIFSMLKAQRPDAGVMVTYGWDIIASLVDSTATDALVPFDMSAEGDSLEVEFVQAYFKEHRPVLSFVYFANLDHTGHAYGWKSEEYHNYLRYEDEMVRRVFDGIREAGMAENTVVILTSDHGGYGRHHSTEYRDEVFRTPLIITGRGIRKGFEISSPTIQMDITATAASLLGIKTPAHCTGRILEEVFE